MMYFHSVLGFLPLAQATTRRVFEWGSINQPSDWILPLAAIVVLLAAARLIYRRDAAELSRPLGWFLTALRMVAYALLWLVFLQPQWRTEREVTQNSRALLLVDTSLSMELPAAQSTSAAPPPSRAERLTRAFSAADWLTQLRKKHDVILWRFDEAPRPLARWTRSDGESAGGPALDDSSEEGTTGGMLDWSMALMPRGLETRLGQSLQDMLEEHRAAAPVSGLVVFTDGGQNSGIGPAAAVELAAEAEIPIHVVGLGSDVVPANVRLRDLLAPARVYPGDDFKITAEVQGEGSFRGSVNAELWSRAADSPEGGASAGQERLEAAESLTIGERGEVVRISFELTPEQLGARTYRVQLKPAGGDANPRDNERETDIEVVDRKSRVLLLAGGPTREYRFLRSQLFRDELVEVHVLLQTADTGVAQEADRLLSSFPDSLAELSRYDAILAIDPDWRKLSDQQIEWLEKWVAEQAGGLMLVAGPINTPMWIREAEGSKLQALYPVEFERSFALGLDKSRDATQPWTIEFTRDGLDAEFLRLEEGLSASQQAWSAFDGVYDCFPVRGPKPAATVYAHFGDPRAGLGEGQLPLLVGQFYGGGRVFYMGTGEMWRLRRREPAFFERFYTQLIRHISQGRLLRGSPRGNLMLERQQYALGQTITVRARLLDDQLQPLEVPTVNLEVLTPEGRLETRALEPNDGRPGNYSGTLLARAEGVYRLALEIPGAAEERLTERFQVRMPDLERSDPVRNDALLSQVAADSGGRYWLGIRAALNPEEGMLSVLKDRSKTVVEVDAPEPLWDNVWVLAAICGLLCLEWLVRRLVRLA